MIQRLAVRPRPPFGPETARPPASSAAPVAEPAARVPREQVTRVAFPEVVVWIHRDVLCSG